MKRYLVTLVLHTYGPERMDYISQTLSRLFPPLCYCPLIKWRKSVWLSETRTMHVQWNLSSKNTLEKGHLWNEDTLLCSFVFEDYSTSGTRTPYSCTKVSSIERFQLRALSCTKLDATRNDIKNGTITHIVTTKCGWITIMVTNASKYLQHHQYSWVDCPTTPLPPPARNIPPNTLHSMVQDQINIRLYTLLAVVYSHLLYLMGDGWRMHGQYKETDRR